MGAKIKSGTETEFMDVKGNRAAGHGEFVENMENGDKNYYKYEFTGTSKNGDFKSGSNKWSVTEGGEKMKGGKASGTCTAKGNADGSTSVDCNGYLYARRNLVRSSWQKTGTQRETGDKKKFTYFAKTSFPSSFPSFRLIGVLNVHKMEYFWTKSRAVSDLPSL